MDLGEEDADFSRCVVERKTREKEKEKTMDGIDNRFLLLTLH